MASVGRKYIVSKGWEGFGDRLQCLSYCINSALRYNRSIYVDWTDTVWKEGFYRYFHFVDLPFVESDKDIPVSSSVYPEFWKNKLMLPANSWVYDMREALAFEPQKSLHYEDVWVHPGVGYREYDFNQLPKNLRLNADIAEEVRSRLVELDLPIVHLRGTDRAVSEEKWAELREKAPVAWVLSEDKALIDRWMQESPDSKVFSGAKEGVTHFSTDVDKHEMNLAVLVDFFAIASAKDAYALNDESLFFSMARVFGGCGGVKTLLPNLDGKIRLHIGGTEARDGWKIFNICPGGNVDYVGDIQDMSAFSDNSIDEIYGSHVLEHVSQEAMAATLQGLYRVLKPDGRLLLSVPDLEVLCKLFLQEDLDKKARFHVMRMMFGGQINASDFHYIGLNYEFLQDYLLAAGFSSCQKVPLLNVFSDTSTFAPYGELISLNVIAHKK